MNLNISKNSLLWLSNLSEARKNVVVNGFAATVTPLIMLSSPFVKNKEDKQYSAVRQIAVSVTTLITNVAIALLVDGAIGKIPVASKMFKNIDKEKIESAKKGASLALGTAAILLFSPVKVFFINRIFPKMKEILFGKDSSDTKDKKPEHKSKALIYSAIALGLAAVALYSGKLKPLINAITSPLNKAVKYIADKDKFASFIKRMVNDNSFAGNFANLTLIASNVVFGMLYSISSLNNKDVPEEQRKFLAIQDVVTYSMVIGLSLLLNKYFGSSAAKKITDGPLFKNWLNKIKADDKTAKALARGVYMGFGISSGIIAHRVISPFLAMPITKTLKMLLDKDKTKKVPDTMNTFTSGINSNKLYTNINQNNDVLKWLNQIQGNKIS